MAALDVARAGRTYGEVPVVGNPTLGVLMLPGYPDFGAYTMTASLGIPLDVSGRRGRYRAEADHGIAAAEARLEATRAMAAAEARQAYVDLVTTQAEVDIQRARLEAAQSIEGRVRARTDVGAGTAVDVALVERERAEAEADLAEARRRQTEADGALRRALDLGPTDPLTLQPLSRPEGLSLGSSPRQPHARSNNGATSSPWSAAPRGWRPPTTGSAPGPSRRSWWAWRASR